MAGSQNRVQPDIWMPGREIIASNRLTINNDRNVSDLFSLKFLDSLNYAAAR